MKIINIVKSIIILSCLCIPIHAFAKNNKSDEHGYYHSSNRIHDADVCAATRRGDILDLKDALKKGFNLRIEEAYLDIWCDESDLMGMIIKSPHERYGIAKYLKRYFTKLGKTEAFSQLLMTQVDARSVLRRIEYQIVTCEENPNLKDSEMHTRLLTMQKKYIKWLKQHPIKGSAKEVQKHLKWREDKAK